MMEGWISGRRAIMEYLKVKAWNTVRKWRREYGLPIYTDPMGKPKAFAYQLDRWLVLFNENKSKGK